MTYRHRDATVGPSGVGVDGAFYQSAPDADLAAGTSVKVTDKMLLQGGVVARYMGSGTSSYGIAPAAGARYDFGPADPLRPRPVPRGRLDHAIRR